MKAFFAIHRANNSGIVGLDNSFNPNSFRAPNGARWANGLWLGSLALSLFVALHAIIAQQWLEDYSLRITEPSATHRSWAWRHVVFSAGFERWKVDAFISVLPLALHLSLLFFFAGLVLFFQTIDPVASFVMAGAAAAGFTFYVMLTFLPLIWRDCPTSTPLLRLALLLFRVFTPKFDCLPGNGPVAATSVKRQEKTHEELLVNERDPFDLDIHALFWMVKYLPAVEDVNAAIDAFGSLQPPTHSNGLFNEDGLDGYSVMRHVVNQRLRMLDAGVGTDAVAIARVLRTTIALSALCHCPIALVHEPTIRHWASTVKQYDVYWLCLVLLEMGPASIEEFCIKEAVEWSKDGEVARDRPYAATTFKSIVNWRIPRQLRITSANHVLRSMLYIETCLKGSPAQLSREAYNRRLLLWLLRDADGAPPPAPEVTSVIGDTLETLAHLMDLGDALESVGEYYYGPTVFEQCVKVAVAEPLQLTSTRDLPVFLRLAHLGSRLLAGPPNSRLSGYALRLLALIVRHDFISPGAWPSEVAFLLRLTFGCVTTLKTNEDLLRRSVELLPWLTSDSHCTVLDIGKS